MDYYVDNLINLITVDLQMHSELEAVYSHV